MMQSMKLPSSGRKSTHYCSHDRDCPNKPSNASRTPTGRASLKVLGQDHTTRAKASRVEPNPQANPLARSPGLLEQQSMDPSDSFVCVFRLANVAWAMTAVSITDAPFLSPSKWRGMWKKSWSIDARKNASLTIFGRSTYGCRSRCGCAGGSSCIIRNDFKQSSHGTTQHGRQVSSYAMAHPST